MLDKEEINQIEKYVDKKITNMKYRKSLYHYTSINKLKNILESKELWFGNTSTMNDKEEFIFFVKKLKEAFYKELSGEAKSRCEEFFSELDERMKNEYPYALSLSEEEEDAAQWDRYADNAKGVCIAFNTQNIFKALYECKILFQKVFYDWDSEKHEHYDVKQNDHYKILNKYFQTGEMSERIGNKKGEMDNLLAVACMRKHYSFRNEKEVRVSTYWKHIPKHGKIESEFVDDKIKRMLKIDMKLQCEDVGINFEELFDKIVIAPKSPQTVEDMKFFLKEKGMKQLAEKVYLSECPLR